MKKEPRGVLTTDGLVLAGDSEHRPGDPIMGPDNRCHYVLRVYEKTAPRKIPFHVDEPTLFVIRSTHSRNDRPNTEG